MIHQTFIVNNIRNLTNVKHAKKYIKKTPTKPNIKFNIYKNKYLLSFTSIKSD